MTKSNCENKTMGKKNPNIFIYDRLNYIILELPPVILASPVEHPSRLLHSINK